MVLGETVQDAEGDEGKGLARRRSRAGRLDDRLDRHDDDMTGYPALVGNSGTPAPEEPLSRNVGPPADYETDSVVIVVARRTRDQVKQRTVTLITHSSLKLDGSGIATW